MKQNKASGTAVTVTSWRAIESSNPNNTRVCFDPFAKHFLSGMYRCIVNWKILIKIAIWYADFRAPGAYGEAVARTRYIDDYLKSCIQNGIKQLVILGAGYDSRAYRCDELKEKAKVFELDHPSTQHLKKKKLRALFGFLPDNVVYIPIDFDREKLGERLFERGYSKKLKTLFIWEGVTAYITTGAVETILAFVVNNSASGSSIIFDYIFQSVIDGTCELKGAHKFRKALIKRGEPPTFGIQENTIEDFLTERGFYQITNVNRDFLKQTYFKGENRNRKVSPWGGLVHATVKRKK